MGGRSACPSNARVMSGLCKVGQAEGDASVGEWALTRGFDFPGRFPPLVASELFSRFLAAVKVAGQEARRGDAHVVRTS